MKIDKDALQREQAWLLRSNGMSLQKAANITGLTKNIVYKLDKDIKVGAADDTLDIKMKNGEACMYCGGELKQNGGAGRPRRFCSDHCRRQYWRLHRDEQKKNPDIVFTRICKFCGQPFEIYGKNDRKYCCRDHYLKHFYGDKEEREARNREGFLTRQLSDLTRIIAG